MSLKHVVLSVVAETPAHGYEIHSRLIETLPIARPCDSSRVYGILVGLERDGWLASTWEDAGRGRKRKRYRLSPQGGRELVLWLERPRPGGALLRRGLLVQLALAAREEAPRSAERWKTAVERRMRRRTGLLRAAADESRMARLLRLRELAHLDAELRVLRDL